MTKMIVAAGLVLAIAGVVIGDRAQAVPIAPGGLRIAADEVAIVDKVQFIYRGRRYCWYWDGWRGPGWYWCGYEWRRGFGWGGPVGWRGWRRPVHRPRPPVARPHRPNRPGVNRPGNRPGVNRPGNRPGASNRPGNRPGAGTNRPSGGRPGNRPGRGRSGGDRSRGQ